MAAASYILTLTGNSLGYHQVRIHNGGMPDYVLLNPPAFSKKSRSRKFIYVLMFNLPGLPPAPFYVGQTNGITARFGGHSMLMWHRAKFNSPAQAWIAGSVGALDADFAEQDLITRLSAAGYLLVNTSIADTAAKRFQETTKLKNMTEKQVVNSLGAAPKRALILPGWIKRWCSTPEYVIIGSKLTREQVVEYVSGLKYRHEAGLQMSRRIAEAHDQELGYSRMLIMGKPQKTLNVLRDIWFFGGAVTKGEMHDFRLTGKRLKALSGGTAPTDLQMHPCETFLP